MNTSRFRAATVPLALALGAGALLVGCGSDSEGTTTTTEAAVAAVTTTAVPAEAGITVAGQWARTSPSMTTAGAVYMEITNGTDLDDALVGASVDASIARTTEIHETTTADGGDDQGDSSMDESDMDESDTGDDMTGTTTMGGDSGGMMTMAPVDEIPLAPGETAALEPGGYHIMLLDLVEPLVAGDTFEVTLTFAESGDVKIEVEVRDSAA